MVNYDANASNSGGKFSVVLEVPRNF